MTTFCNEVFCPVCSSQREIQKPSIPWMFVVLVSLLWAVFLGGVAGLLFDAAIGGWSAIIFGVLCFLGLEVYYTLKFKRELVCPVCGFDPILFRRSPEEAKKKCIENVKRRGIAFRKKALRDTDLSWSKELDSSTSGKSA